MKDYCSCTHPVALAAVPDCVRRRRAIPPDTDHDATTDAGYGQRGHRLELLRLRIQLAELRFASIAGELERRIGSAASIRGRRSKSVSARSHDVQARSPRQEGLLGDEHRRQCKERGREVTAPEDRRAVQDAAEGAGLLGGKTAATAPSTSANSDSSSTRRRRVSDKRTQQAAPTAELRLRVRACAHRRDGPFDSRLRTRLSCVWRRHARCVARRGCTRRRWTRVRIADALAGLSCRAATTPRRAVVRALVGSRRARAVLRLGG